MLGIILFLTSIEAFAQGGTQSPYSRFGLGIPNYNKSSMFGSMGGSSVAFGDYDVLNIQNASSYGYLNRYTPLFQIELNSRFSQYSTSNSSIQNNTFRFENLSMAFPIHKDRLGFGFGITPEYLVGYEISSSEMDTNVGQVNYRYNGEGDINNFHFGLGYKVLDRDSLQLSVGVQGSYLFGKIENQANVLFDNSSGFLSSRYNRILNVNGLVFNLSTLLKYKLNNGSKISLGVNYQVGKDINAKSTQLGYNYAFQGVVERIFDTIEFTEDDKGSITIPTKLSFGLNYQVNDRLLLTAQYQSQNWSSYKESFSNFSFNNNLNNSNRISVGGSYQAHGYYVPLKSVFERAIYRFGAYTGNTQFEVNNTQISENGITFGVGLPISAKNSEGANYSYKHIATLNLGFEYNVRGTHDDGLIRERNSNIYIGVTFTPKNPWFRKIEYK